jgi:hypothetical protein
MNIWHELQVSTLWKTAALTVLLWFIGYGLNVVLRAWHVRRNLATREVVERVTVVQKRRPKTLWGWGWLNRIYIGLALLGFIRLCILVERIGLSQLDYLRMTDVESLGLELGALLTWALWLFYRKSKTVNALELHFDRDGVTIFPARLRLSGQGIYQTRVEWKDCYGYWIFKGYFVLAMRPIGQVEQYGGSELERLEKILDALGVRKLVSYDMREAGELSRPQLQALNDRVVTLANEVIAGFQTECARLGLHITAEADERQEDELFSVLMLRAWVDGEIVNEIEWLLWGEDGESLETLGLADDRLYEGLDERVASMVETRQQELGRELPEVLYQ